MYGSLCLIAALFGTGGCGIFLYIFNFCFDGIEIKNYILYQNRNDAHDTYTDFSSQYQQMIYNRLIMCNLRFPFWPVYYFMSMMVPALLVSNSKGGFWQDEHFFIFLFLEPYKEMNINENEI